jgi:Ca2+-binding RTX toxin-like protein
LRPLSALVTALLAVAFGASPAAAAIQAVYSPGGNALVASSDGAGDAIAVTCSAGTALVAGAAVPIDPLDPKAGVLSCALPGSIEIDAGPGADLLDVRGVDPAAWTGLSQLTVEGGDGADTLLGAPIDGALVLGTLSGGDDADRLVPAGETTVAGGPGDDRIEGFGAPGALLDGGSGSDQVAIDLSAGPAADATLLPTAGGLSYSPTIGPDTTVAWASIERFDAILDGGAQHVDAFAFPGSVSLDGRGGADTLIGGPLADELRGGDGDDLVEGGEGADLLTGGEGADDLRGGDGDDAADGGDGPDTLGGGDGADTLEGGAGADDYAGGDGPDLLRARDDVADGGDCGPGHDTLIADAIDVVVGCEVVDLPPVPEPPVDPPPTTPSPSVPGPTPIPAPKPNPATVKPGWKVRGSVTTITSLRVARAAAGSVVELRCSGRKCPFSTRRTAKARNGVIDALAPLTKRSHKRLRAGQTLEVRVTAPGYVGKVLRYAVRKGKRPTVTTLCLPVGKAKPQARC